MKRQYRGSLSFNAADLCRVSMATGIAVGEATYRGYSESDVEGMTLKQLREHQSLGSLFGSMNEPQFHPDITAADVAPKSEDYVSQPFRLLSATTVGAGTWKATDFSNEKMLKKSVSMLADKPVYKDHEVDTDNWSGFVRNPKWTNSFVDSEGRTIPAGIDADVEIDVKVDPKLARGILSKAVYSNSVTVEFDWEMSHQFENVWDFIDLVGTMHEDGTMIRRVATKIHNYHESSMVFLGADPFAKAIEENGDLKNIDVSGVLNFSKDGKKPTEQEKETLKNNKKYTINFAVDNNLLSLKHTNSSKQQLTTKKVSMDNQFITAFVAMFGKPLGLTKENLLDKNFSESKINEAIAKLKLSDPKADETNAANVALVATLKEKAGGAEDLGAFMEENEFIKSEELTALNTKVTELTAQAEVGRAYQDEQRKEAIRLYKLTVGEDKADEAVIKLIQDSPADAIGGLISQYTKGATQKFGGKCADCGSKNFSFQSSITDNQEQPTEDSHVISFEGVYKINKNTKALS